MFRFVPFRLLNPQPHEAEQVANFLLDLSPELLTAAFGITCNLVLLAESEVSVIQRLINVSLQTV